MPYKYTSKGKRRFMAGTGVRFLKDGRVRCQAVRRNVAKQKRWADPTIKVDDLWPEFQCHLAARPGYYVCRWHGAGWTGGPRPGAIAKQMKKATDYIKKDLADKYRTFAEDPELFNMRHTASLMQARNAELLENLEEGSLSHPKKIESLRRGLEFIRGGDPIKGAQVIDETIASLAAEKDAWEEIRKNSAVFKDLTNAEISRQKEMRLAMSQEQVFSLIDRLFELMVVTVTEKVDLPKDKQDQIIRFIDGGVHDLMGSGARTLLTASSNNSRKDSRNSESVD